MVTTGDDMAAIHHQDWSTVESMMSDSLRLCVGDYVAQLDGGALLHNLRESVDQA